MKIGIQLKSIIVLTVVCLVWGGILAAVYDLTKESVEKAENEEISSILLEIFPDGQFVKENDYFECLEDGRLVGYAIIASGKGYGGEMEIIIGMDLNNNVEGVRVLSHGETVGIGSKITENWFLSQFEGKALESLRLEKNGGEIDAITGATISSNAFTNAVHDGVQILIEITGGEE